MNSTPRGSSIAASASASTIASPATHSTSEGTNAGGEDIRMEIENQHASIDGGRGSRGDDHEDADLTPEFIDLPPGFAPNLPGSSEPPSLQNKPKRLVWVIFGATGHLGRSICRTALEMGDNVTAVGRDIDGEDVMQGWHARCQGLVCDVRVRKTVELVMEKAKGRWGRVDIIANCAGFGIIGSCEDQDETDIRSQFDTNVIGTLNILQLSLPYFRERRYGRYIIFSSIAGFSGIPGLGPYGATKFAVEGLVESLMYEIAPFGVKATLVEPSLSRRDEPDEFMANHLPPLWGHFLIKPPSAPYKPTTSPAQHAIKMVDWLKYNQPTSAVKIAKIVWELAHCNHPPLRLLMGSHAVETTRDRLRAIIEEVEEWKHLNFPNDHELQDHGNETAEEAEQSRTERESDGDAEADGEDGEEEEEEEDEDEDNEDLVNDDNEEEYDDDNDNSNADGEDVDGNRLGGRKDGDLQQEEEGDEDEDQEEHGARVEDGGLDAVAGGRKRANTSTSTTRRSRRRRRTKF